MEILVCKENYYKLAIESNAFNIVKKFDIAYYKFEKEGSIPSFDVDRDYIDICDKYGLDFVNWCRNQNTNSHIKVIRLRKRIESYLSLGTCLWISLNFRNDVLNNTDVKTRRKYVSRFLKSISAHYVANIDFGSDKEYIDRHGNLRKATNREHYHAIVLADFCSDTWEYGFINRQKIRINKKTKYRLADYVVKLTNHAKKVGFESRYIYSRDKENINWDEIFN